jgi:hypothetical protein
MATEDMITGGMITTMTTTGRGMIMTMTTTRRVMTGAEH